MTIKEVEAQSGMTRANIRFYESEGLLSPARGANGYRDYSQEDLEILKRIRLLRTLHLSLAEIKAVSRGESELSDALIRQLNALEQERGQLETAREVCQLMREDGVRYETLNAQHYLDVLERPADDQTPPTPVPELVEDVIPKVCAPWRRFLARLLDLALYSTVIYCVLALVFRINPLDAPWCYGSSIISLVMTLALEPVLLSFLGTTFGKWLFGLRVTANDGSRLSREEAMRRTVCVLWKGMAFLIPIWELIRLGKCYMICDESHTLPWEYNSTLVQKDEKVWRFGLWLGARAALTAVLCLAIASVAMPPHQGELTVAEFCENYNYVARYYNHDEYQFLDENGTWFIPYEYGAHLVDMDETSSPTLHFTTDENGIMTGVSWSYESENSSEWPPFYTDQMSYCVLAFAHRGLLTKTAALIEPIGVQSFTIERCGIKASCEISYSGYDHVYGLDLLAPQEENSGEFNNEYHFSFSMKRV